MATQKAKRESQLLKNLVNGSVSLLEEILPDPAPVKLLKQPRFTPSYGLRGTITESVQTFLGGDLDLATSCQYLADELAPFVDGEALGFALRSATKGKKVLPPMEEFLGEFVDQFAIRALDDMARGILALALGRPDDVPATCQRFRPLLESKVDKVKNLLNG